jgi:hypothetical protein
MGLQTMVAMSMIIEEIIAEAKTADYLYKGMDEDCGRFLVLSIGTGLTSDAGLYTAAGCSKWGMFGWLRKKGMAPIIDIFMAASSDLVDIHIAVKFQLFKCEKNYLRIQDNNPSRAASAVDEATPENMRHLIETAEHMLDEPVSRVDIKTGKYEKRREEGTNRQALIGLAKQLSDERKERHNHMTTVMPQ